MKHYANEPTPYQQFISGFAAGAHLSAYKAEQAWDSECKTIPKWVRDNAESGGFEAGVAEGENWKNNQATK